MSILFTLLVVFLIIFTSALLARAEDLLLAKQEKNIPLSLVEHILVGPCWFYSWAYEVGTRVGNRFYGPENEKEE